MLASGGGVVGGEGAGEVGRRGGDAGGDGVAEGRAHFQLVGEAGGEGVAGADRVGGLDRLGVDPATCVYVGDAERDVLAAQAAGMRAYVALYGYIPSDERPRNWPASGWIETPQAVAPWLRSLLEN